MKKLLALLLVLLLALSTTAMAEKYFWGCLAYGNFTETQVKELTREIYRVEGITEFMDDTAFDDWGVRFYDDLPSALLALQRGDIEELALSRSTAEYIMRTEPERYALEIEWHKDFFAWSMTTLSENARLLDALNAAISELREDGTLAALEGIYLAPDAEMPEPSEMPYFEGAETIRVLVTGDYPPRDYVTADGKPAGYNVALLSAIAEKLGVNIELVQADTGSRVINLTSGSVDALLWMFGVWDAETQTYDYTGDVPEGFLVTEPCSVEDDVVLVLAPEK